MTVSRLGGCRRLNTALRCEPRPQRSAAVAEKHTDPRQRSVLLARRGITGGCDANNYCPGNSVTRGQMAIFILHATTVRAHIAPQGGLDVGGVLIPGGSVFVGNVADGAFTTLDGFTFRAAPAETTLSAPREPTSISLQALRDMFK